MAPKINTEVMGVRTIYRSMQFMGVGIAFGLLSIGAIFNSDILRLQRLSDIIFDSTGVRVRPKWAMLALAILLFSIMCFMVTVSVINISDRCGQAIEKYDDIDSYDDARYLHVDHTKFLLRAAIFSTVWVPMMGFVFGAACTAYIADMPYFNRVVYIGTMSISALLATIAVVVLIIAAAHVRVPNEHIDYVSAYVMRCSMGTVIASVKYILPQKPSVGIEDTFDSPDGGLVDVRSGVRIASARSAGVDAESVDIVIRNDDIDGAGAANVVGTAYVHPVAVGECHLLGVITEEQDIGGIQQYTSGDASQSAQTAVEMQSRAKDRVAEGESDVASRPHAKLKRTASKLMRVAEVKMTHGEMYDFR